MEEYYSVVSQKIYTLTKFVNTRAIDFGSLAAYVNEMMQLWTRVQSAGFDINDKTAGSLMLGGLPEQYQSMVMGIENSGKEITVDFVKNLLLQDVLFDKLGGSSDNALWLKTTVVMLGKSRKKHQNATTVRDHTLKISVQS